MGNTCIKKPEESCFQAENNYFDIVLYHYDLEYTKDLYNQISMNSEEKLYSLTYSKFLETQFKESTDPLCIQDKDLMDLELMRLYMLSYVFYRIHKYHEIHKFPTKQMEYFFMSAIKQCLTNQKYQEQIIKYQTILAFLYNFSKGLIDKEAEYLDEFPTCMAIIEKVLFLKNEPFYLSEEFNPSSMQEKAIKMAIFKFKSSLKSQWIKESLKKLFFSICVGEENIEFANEILENIKIFISFKKIGLNGMVGFDFIVISIENIVLDCGYVGKNVSFENVIIARTFVLIWHEAAHLLVRKLKNNYLSTTPRGLSNEKWEYYETGYRLE